MSRTSTLLDVTIDELDKDIERSADEIASAVIKLQESLENPEASVKERFACNNVVIHAEDYRRDLESVRRRLVEARTLLAQAW